MDLHELAIKSVKEVFCSSCPKERQSQIARIFIKFNKAKQIKPVNFDDVTKSLFIRLFLLEIDTFIFLVVNELTFINGN